MVQPPSNTTVAQLSEVNARFVIVTPELAAEWLETANKVNRPKRKRQVGSLTADMNDELWEQNGEPLVFDTDGIIVNGQHRLTALVESGTTQEFLVVYNVLPRVRSTVDAHTRRTFADDLAMNGVANGVTRETLLRMMLRWDRNGGLTDNSWVATRRLMAARYPTYRDEISDTIGDTVRWLTRYPGNRIAMRFTYWLLAIRLGYDIKRVEKFFSILTIGSQDEFDRMVVRMRDKIAVPVSVASTGRITHMEASLEVFWLIQAWNRWVTGSNSPYSTPRTGINDPYPHPESPEVPA